MATQVSNRTRLNIRQFRPFPNLSCNEQKDFPHSLNGTVDIDIHIDADHNIIITRVLQEILWHKTVQAAVFDEMKPVKNSGHTFIPELHTFIFSQVTMFNLLWSSPVGAIVYRQIFVKNLNSGLEIQ